MQRRKQSRLSPIQAFDMGSKISFGRGSSGQNTVSELTSDAPLPHSFIHVPSDCKQVDERCAEDILCGGEMKGTSLNQPAPDSESDCHVRSETISRMNCRQTEDVPSKVRMSTRSQLNSAGACSSTTDSLGDPVDVHRKCRRPRKIQPSRTRDKADPDVAVAGAVQHKEVSTTIPSPSGLNNHSGENVPNTLDNHLISPPSQNETSGPDVVLKDKLEADATLLVNKRGRSKRSKVAASKTAAARASSISCRAVSNLTWSLRSRAERNPSTQSGKSQSNDDVKQSDTTPSESSNTTYNNRVKRRRITKFPISQQDSEKMTRLDDSQEASAVLSSDTDCVGKTETDKQVEPITETHETDMDGNGKLFSPHSGEVQEQESKVTENVLPQNELPSGHHDSEDLNSLNLAEPKQTEDPKVKQSVEEPLSKSSNPSANPDSQSLEPSSTDVVMSSEQTPKSVGNLPVVKTESVEVNLDHSIPLSQSNGYKSNITVKSESPNKEQSLFRRKRGGKRRRRINNVRREKLIEKQDLTQQQTECDDVKEEDIPEAIYIKKGSKTLLKCSCCNRIYKFMSQFVIHQRVHTGERPYKCPECGRGFSKNSNLNLHLKTHERSMYQKCQICKIRLAPSEYDAHMTMHDLELEMDNTTSEKQITVNAHETETSKEVQKAPVTEKDKMKVCQYCGKMFTFQSALIRHIRIHTGEKPYKCDICGKAFGQSYFLRVHELTHWPVKRYNCTRCGKSFGHYSNAKNHTCRPMGGDGLQSNKHTKPLLTYTCHICRKILNHLQEFNSHMKEHTGMELIRCMYCDKLFSEMSEFDAHRSRCIGNRKTSSAFIKKEETVTLIRYKVPTVKVSSEQNSAPVTTSYCELKKKPLQVKRKKHLTKLKTPVQSTVIPPQHLSPLVSKLNQLDTRSDPRKYQCPNCGRQFRHMGRLRAHMLTHAPAQSYTCACCGKTLRSWNKLWHHQRVHRQRSGRFTCPQCGRGFRFVGAYKKHMNEHPDFHWIDSRPRKASEPYQCEQCSCSFKTLDLLFNHQLCHPSTLIISKDSDFELLMDDSQSNNKTSSPSSNNNPVSPLHKYPDLVSQKSPLVPIVCFASSQSQNVAHSPQEREIRQDRVKEIPSGNPTKSLSAANSLMIKSTSRSNEGASDDFYCAVCGNAFLSVSDLFHHYLEHARGQV